MEDPRMASRAAPVHIVEATSIPLSERFGKVPCHNPLRPNPNVGGPVRRNPIHDDFFETSDDQPRPLFGNGNGNRRLADTLDLSPGVNKLAVLRAAKDAEILRLQAKLQNAQKQLRSGGGHGGGRNGNGNGGLKTIQKNGGLIFKNRVGGGVLAGHGGRKEQMVHLTNEAALELLQTNQSRIGVSPLKRNGKGKKGYSTNFFDEPRSKEELDDELDAYMSKRKGGLDKELDSYMSVARSKYLAARARAQADGGGASGAQVNETPQTAPDTDKEMDTTYETDEEIATKLKKIEEELAAMEAEDD